MGEQAPTATYEWHIDVLERDYYGDRIVRTTPMTVSASTRAQVTTKVRVAFGATYDGFRKFWSHTWRLREVRELAALPAPAPTEPTERTAP